MRFSISFMWLHCFWTPLKICLQYNQHWNHWESLFSLTREFWWTHSGDQQGRVINVFLFTVSLQKYFQYWHKSWNLFFCSVLTFNLNYDVFFSILCKLCVYFRNTSEAADFILTICHNYSGQSYYQSNLI